MFKQNKTIQTVLLGSALLLGASGAMASGSTTLGMSGKGFSSLQQAISAAKEAKFSLVKGSDPAAFVIVFNPSQSTIHITGQDAVGGYVTHDLAPAADGNDTSAWTIDDGNYVDSISVSLTDNYGNIYNSTDVRPGTCLLVHKDGRGVTQTSCF